MIISHSHRFIFFHIPKTGGSSFKNILWKYCMFDLNQSKGEKKLTSVSKLIFNNVEKNLLKSDNYSQLPASNRLMLKFLHRELTKGKDEVFRRDIGKLLDNPKNFFHVYNSFNNKNFPKTYSFSGEHVSVNTVRKSIPSDIFDNYFKFAIVRNPLDWITSFFYYTRFKQEKKKNNPNYADINSFVNYLENNQDDVIDYGLSCRSPQYNYLCDQNGKLLVDYVGHFEDLNKAWDDIRNKIKVSEPDLPHINRFKEKGKVSKEIKSQELISRIHDLFKLDFEKLGYNILD